MATRRLPCLSPRDSSFRNNAGDKLHGVPHGSGAGTPPSTADTTIEVCSNDREHSVTSTITTSSISNIISSSMVTNALISIPLLGHSNINHNNDSSSDNNNYDNDGYQNNNNYNNNNNNNNNDNNNGHNNNSNNNNSNNNNKRNNNSNSNNNNKNRRLSKLMLMDSKDTIDTDSPRESFLSISTMKNRDRERDRERSRPQARKGLMGFKGFKAAMEKTLQLSNRIGRPKCDIPINFKEENSLVRLEIRAEEERKERRETRERQSVEPSLVHMKLPALTIISRTDVEKDMR